MYLNLACVYVTNTAPCIISISLHAINSLHAEYSLRLLLSSANVNSKLTFFKNSYRHTIRVSNGLYPDQNRRSVGTELGSNYLQMLSADKERVENLGNNEYKSG